jgi:hypothetical protein
MWNTMAHDGQPWTTPSLLAPTSLTPPPPLCAFLDGLCRYPDLSHVCLASHEAPDEADPLLQTAWRISVG